MKVESLRCVGCDGGGTWGTIVAADVHGVRGTHRLHANTAEPTQGRDILEELKVDMPSC